jgi:hypothetical protein
MNLDLLSLQVMTALVVIVSGVIYVIGTVIRRDEGSSRLWSVAFLSGTVCVIAYLVWAADRHAWWAIAVGNATFVGVTGALWLGCRAYNGRRMRWSAVLSVTGIVAAFVGVIAQGPDGGDWAGAVAMFLALAVFGAVGCVECLRGELFATRTAWALAIVLGLQCVYFTVRTVGFVVWGPESALFQAWLGTIPMSFLVVTFTIVTLVATSVLRAGRTQVRGVEAIVRNTGVDVGVMAFESFTAAARGVLTRSQWRHELVAVFAVRIDDLDQISTAFGSEVARGVAETWRSGVRRHAPAAARIGQDGVNGLVGVTVVATAAEARTVATRIAQGVFEELRAVPGSVIPDVGVGLALSDTLGSDLDTLMAAARADSAGGEPVAHAADRLDPSRP